MTPTVAVAKPNKTTGCDSLTPEPEMTLTDDRSDRLSILLVDDEATTRMMLRAAMENEGFRVVEARNGLECIDLYKKERPDIVLLDAVMPEMDGFSCCAALQDLSDKQSVELEAEGPPILIITCLEDSQSVEQAFAAGATDYVTKPIHWALLRHRVRGLRDSIKHRQAEAEIRRSLKEKEALLKEVHHRVKNNLQIISSLLSLQAGTIADLDALGCLRESQNRVRLMAMIHEKLYQSDDLGKIDLADYIQDLSSYVTNSYGIDSNRVRLSIDINNIFLQTDTAVSCGLIINELISNSLKYAFPELKDSSTASQIGTDKEKTIEIVAKPTGSGYFFVTYKDNGIGLPEELDIENVTTLGLQLVSTLTEQLGGLLAIQKGKPTEFNLTHLPLF